jgi:hypothetical protein
MFSPRRKRSSIARSTVSPANETAALMIMNKKEIARPGRVSNIRTGLKQATPQEG